MKLDYKCCCGSEFSGAGETTSITYYRDDQTKKVIDSYETFLVQHNDCPKLQQY